MPFRRNSQARIFMRPEAPENPPRNDWWDSRPDKGPGGAVARRIPYLRLCPVVTRDEWICTGVVDVAVVVGEG